MAGIEYPAVIKADSAVQTNAEHVANGLQNLQATAFVGMIGFVGIFLACGRVSENPKCSAF